ncbi:MAG: hypothetical protein ACNA8W_17565, partial [Bradymonadaceae bacterium]
MKRHKAMMVGGMAVAILAAATVLLSSSEGATDPDGWLNNVEFEAGGPETAGNIQREIIAEINGARLRVFAAVG